MAGTDWRAELDGWLGPFLAALGHGKRRRWAPVYLRGLIGPGERKSLQPMAARLGLEGHDQLHHLLTSTAWDDAPLRRLLVERADALVGGPDAVLVVDDTALPKQGKHSAGVARQCCGCLGKRANCQVLVSLTLARGEVPVRRSGCACSCRRRGPPTPGAAPAQACPRSIAARWRRPKSRSRKLTACWPPAPASAAWSRTPATASAPPFVRV